MPLKGKKPTAILKRFKCLLYGPAGVGKTTACTQFPNSYFIDTERGSENEEYVDRLLASGASYYFSNEFDDIITEVRSLLTEKHKFQTVVIDPITVPYNDMSDREAQRLAEASTDPNSDGSEFGRNKKVPDRKVRHLINLLLRLDMNVIVTAHSKPKWEKSGTSFKEIGTTFDGYVKLDYLFDLSLELQKRGKERTAIVRKTRLAEFPDGSDFPFSYEEVAKRYGVENLERSVAVESLAIAADVVELKRLTELLKITEETTDKWLEKAKAATFEEMPKEVISKCIDHLKQKITTGGSDESNA